MSANSNTFALNYLNNNERYHYATSQEISQYFSLAQKYEENLCHKEFNFAIYVKNKGLKLAKIKFEPEYFLHLVGLSANSSMLKAEDIYYTLLNSEDLESNNVSILDNTSVLNKKQQAFYSILKIASSKYVSGTYNKEELIKQNKISSHTQLNFDYGFEKGDVLLGTKNVPHIDHLIPCTLIKSDISYLIDPHPIILTTTKTPASEPKITFVNKDMSTTFLKKTLNILQDTNFLGSTQQSKSNNIILASQIYKKYNNYKRIDIPSTQKQSIKDSIQPGKSKGKPAPSKGAR